MSTKPPRKNSSARNSTARQPLTTENKTDENELPKPIAARTLPPADKDAASKAAESPAPVSDEPDAFENAEDSDDDNVEITRASVDLDELPIELVQLIDNFVASLNAKVHSAPPNIKKLSSLFQDFYATAHTNINTHISALATRQSRDASPAPSISSISTAASKLRSRTTSHTSLGAKAKEHEQQMITTEQLADRKRARKALEARKALLEEVVERRLCEGIYNRIYRHRSTQDEAQDDKLRSKTAALALVGIGPTDLGIDLGQEESRALTEPVLEKAKLIREQLENAREDLIKMHNSRYPLGKLNHLKAAHRSIVDTLAHFHPSASADEIMPMLIFTLITLPPEELNVISDVHFIQYFRWEPKLTGEAAYCLTNLEAAISFLQTVDLATLREDELPSGPAKQSQPGDSKTETFPPAYQSGVTEPTQSVADTTNATAVATKPAGSPAGLKAATVLRNRRLSDLVNTPAQAFGAASDAVITTADQGIKTISNSLGDSYNFLLGKLREREQGLRESIVVPRTLDDARKLVSTPPPDDDEFASTEFLKRPITREDRVLSLIGGRRDPSADSNRSGSSARKFLSSAGDDAKQPATASSPGQNPAVLEQMRNLSNNFNPMARLTSIGPFRGFGRNAAAPAPPAKDVKPAADGGDLATAFPDIAAALPPKRTPKVAPPNRRFMELQTPGDLKLGEVLDLLKDYRRLANALKERGAFEDK